MNLDCAFDEIVNKVFHSEQEATEKREILASVRNEIKRISREIEEVEAENGSAQSSIDFHTAELSECESEVRHAELKLEILASHLDAAVREAKLAEHDLSLSRKELEDTREAFCERASQFFQRFHVGDGGQKYLENELHRKMLFFQKEEQDLTDNISKLTESKDKFTKGNATEVEQKSELERLKMMIVDCEKHARNLDMQISVATETRDELSRLPQTDQAYLKLRKQLDTLRNRPTTSSEFTPSRATNGRRFYQNKGNGVRNGNSKVKFPQKQQLTLDRFWKQ